MTIDIAILTAIPEELAAAKKVLNLIQPPRKIDDRAWHFGEVRSELWNRTYSLGLVCLGRAGNIGSAEVATSAIISPELKPKVIILVGIAAGIQTQTKIGEVLFSESVYGYESGVNTGDGFQPRPSVPSVSNTIIDDVVNYQSDGERLQRILEIFQGMGGTFEGTSISKLDEENVCQQIMTSSCVMASGEKLLRDDQFLPELRDKQHSRIKIAEMEAIGFAKVCSGKKKDWLVIRSISDFGNPDKNDDFHEFASKLAVSVLADFLIHGLHVEVIEPEPVPIPSEVESSKKIAVSLDFHILRFLQKQKQEGQRVSRSALVQSLVKNTSESSLQCVLNDLLRQTYISGSVDLELTSRGEVQLEGLLQSYRKDILIRASDLLNKLLPADFNAMIMIVGIRENDLTYPASQNQRSTEVIRLLERGSQGVENLEELIESVYARYPYVGS